MSPPFLSADWTGKEQQRPNKVVTLLPFLYYHAAQLIVSRAASPLSHYEHGHYTILMPSRIPNFHYLYINQEM